ncbi:lysylphosphatidylglycerol synthase transmembrane domain-containing protein [Candidatus Planktophila versatilis]|nr:lysylphosphatidylglycerol synthase transmembrane domain-containing protein [Candidatus Planktophila versatilis]
MFSIALCLVFLGTIFRGLRTREMLMTAAETKLSLNIFAYVISSAINMITPFRLGEVMRILYLRRVTKVSGYYIALVVVIERTIDLILITLVSLLMLNTSESQKHFIALIIGCFSVILFILISLMVRPLLRMISSITSNLSEDLQWKTKHSLWVAMYGFKKFVSSPRSILLYMGYTLVSWTFYFGGVWISFRSILNNQFEISQIVAPFTDYLTLAKQSIHNFERHFLNIGLNLSSENITELSLVAWVVLNLPILVIALTSLIWFKRITRVKNETDSLLSKFSMFDSDSRNIVDYYISSDPTLRKLHELEFKENFQILKIYKGGSQALTCVVKQEGGVLEVLKSTSSLNEEKLKMQYLWLVKFKSHPEIVSVYKELRNSHVYGYSMQLADDFVPFYDFIHLEALSKSEEILRNIHVFLRDHIYVELVQNSDESVYATYFEKRIIDAVQNAKSSDRQFSLLWDKTEIVINGELRINANVILKQNREHIERAMRNFTRSENIHGDLTVDNILIDPVSNKFLLIDPSDDNTLRGPVLDFARLLQSLEGGYEFLNHSNEKPRYELSDTPTITFVDQRTHRYEQLAESVRDLAKSYLTESENENLDLHIGLLYLRMLPHQIRINPERTLIYYLKAVEFLNRWHVNLEMR